MAQQPKGHEPRTYFELPHWLSDAPHAAAQTFLVVREAIRRVLFEESLTMHAAAIAFYGLLSFGPVILVVLATGGLFLSGQADLMETIKENLTVVFPAAHKELVDQLTSFVAKSKVFGLVGVVGLLWSGSRVFASLDTSLNDVWRVAQTRPYWKHRLLAMGLVPLLLLLFMSSMAITSIYSLVMGSQWASNSGIAELPLIADVVRYVIPPLLSWAIFFGLYWFLPARPVPARSALIGSAVAAALWELAKLVFDIFLRNFGRMDTVYGTAAGIVILMLWFYYSAMTFLVGAVVGASDMDRRITQSAQRRVRKTKR
jgi:membrane protein